MWEIIEPNALYHYGILGMKWGVRRYQNADGSLTEAGKKRYLKNEEKAQRKEVRAQKKKAADIRRSAAKSQKKEERNQKAEERQQKKKKIAKRAIVTGAVATATALTAIGGYTLYKEGKLKNVFKKSDIVDPIVEKARNMSTDELTKAVTKMKLEASYVQRIKENAPKKTSNFDTIEKGLGIASSAVISAGNVYSIVKSRRENKKPAKTDDDLSNMSDQELRDKVSRMNMERQYHNLKKENAPVSSGKDAVEKALDSIGKSVNAGKKAVEGAKEVEKLFGELNGT